MKTMHKILTAVVVLSLTGTISAQDNSNSDNGHGTRKVYKDNSGNMPSPGSDVGKGTNAATGNTHNGEYIEPNASDRPATTGSSPAGPGTTASAATRTITTTGSGSAPVASSTSAGAVASDSTNTPASSTSSSATTGTSDTTSTSANNNCCSSNWGWLGLLGLLGLGGLFKRNRNANS